jgi:hypothetical protein
MVSKYMSVVMGPGASRCTFLERFDLSRGREDDLAGKEVEDEDVEQHQQDLSLVKSQMLNGSFHHWMILVVARKMALCHVFLCFS